MMFYKTIRAAWIFCLLQATAGAQVQFPVAPVSADRLQYIDWLIQPVATKAAVYTNAAGDELILYNGLLKRKFSLRQNLVCIEYRNMRNGQQLLRAVSPEAELVINGQSYAVGGLRGQKEKAYLLPQWIDSLQKGPADFVYEKTETVSLTNTVQWKQQGWWMPPAAPAKGIEVRFVFRSSLPQWKALQVRVHYAVYEGIPLLSKWVSLVNDTGEPIKLDRVKNEILALVEEESAVVGSPSQMKKPQGIYVETNYAFNNAMRYSISDQTTHWLTDSSYTSQVNYNYETPCILEVYPDKAPGIWLQPGETFTSVRSYELLMDSYDRERRGLAIRKMYRTVAPWILANPVFMHLVSKNDEEVRTAIDQCAATGYEALILSFGSHCNMEDTTTANLQRWKGLTDYAHGKGIKIGGYALFSSRRISDADDVISPVTGKPGGAFFGNAPCFGSHWGLGFRDKIKLFFTS
ncbi:MAG: alpha-galactosidase, partial [Chitinophagaceae bacterium]|nr:alpha-galactosidase [Chitinophagaceae bacterium]